MNDDFTETIINFIGATVEECEQTRKNVHKAIVRDTINDTPKKSGLAVRNWQAAKDTVPTSVIPYSDGGAGAAAAQAMFEAQSKAFGSDGTFYFANNVFYVPYLELGTSRMAAVGMARRAVKNAADDLRARFG